MGDPRPNLAPLTVEGWFVLHQWFRVDWSAWRERPSVERSRIATEACEWLRGREGDPVAPGAAFALLGHKGDLLLVHYRRTLDDLLRAQLEVSNLRLTRFLDATGSYCSVVELGMYEGTAALAEKLAAAGTAPGTPEWATAVATEREQKREAMKGRLWAEIPDRRYVCFYPMDKKREGADNWYRLPIAERAALMKEHGALGRRYAGRVNQVISGSIGFDDWEWGVTLFADDPLVFKELVSEMRFDEASSRYGRFGSFVVGVRVPASGLGAFLEGHAPAIPAAAKPA